MRGNLICWRCAVVTWSQFEGEAPELAGLALARFKATDLMMLGTLRKDGFPRISPIEWAIFDGDLTLGGMWQAKKALDLLRDPRCTLHSTTANKNGQEGDAKLWGRARPLPEEREERYWRKVFDDTGWRPAGPAHVFTIDIESAAYLVFTADGTMRRLQWPGDGDWIETKSE
jgi:hypothetical protein